MRDGWAMPDHPKLIDGYPKRGGRYCCLVVLVSLAAVTNGRLYRRYAAARRSHEGDAATPERRQTCLKAIIEENRKRSLRRTPQFARTESQLAVPGVSGSA